jgi:hypothetical protein
MSGEGKQPRIDRTEFDALRSKVEAMGDRTEFDALRSSVAELRSKLTDALEQLEELRAAARHGLTVQRPRALSLDEVKVLLEAKPAQQYLCLAPFPAAGLTAGDRFDARTRFQRPDILMLHVQRGLQVAIPPPQA